MKIVYKNQLDTSKRIYQCAVCGEYFNWNKESMWYGSDWQVEHKPERIKYFCSKKCISIWRNQGK
jgi:endogenous inhibitor of DNA gyrase (YacG/DUF329 family)